MKEKTMKKLLLLVTLALLGIAAHAQKMSVATYNIRCITTEDNRNGNGWDVRCPVIADLVRFHDFDIWGAQEVVMRKQLDDLQAALPEYAYAAGAGRDDGKDRGEAAPIFYKKDRFELQKEGFFWLSEKPDEPSKGWDAQLPRICAWGVFRDKESGKTFWVFNLHMDHVGVTARSEGAKLVMERIRQMCGDLPTIFMGDFNVDQHNPSYKLVAESGLLRCAYEASPIRYAHNSSFNSFNTQNAPKHNRIDHIFVTKHFKVERYGILADVYSPQEGSLRFPSDHFPVKAVLSYENEK
jgi:endonuclease/exonuclease/phosphatase family metal-dependent hydrolase